MKRQTVLKATAVPAILLVGALAMNGLGSTQRQSNRREVTPEPRAVETERLAFGDLTLEVEGDGVVESERTLDIVSEASGKVLFAKDDLKDGTFVREGEVVLRMDSRDVENDLYALRSDFLNAVASVLPELQIDDARIYRRWFDYFNSLDIDRSVPELPEITNAQEKIKISTKNIIGKYYAVRNQEILLSKYAIRAPFDGYIGSNGVIEGSFVSTGQHLFTLTDPKNLMVTVPLLVEESQSLDFSTVPQVTIYADEGSDETKTGRITRKEATIDRNSQTLNVYVTFANTDLNPNFLPGSYVHVSIQGRTLRDVAPVPRHLLDPEAYVYTYVDGSLGRQQLEVVAYQGDLAVVKNSIPQETVIVTTILQKPLVGMDIRSTNMPELNGEVAEEAESDPESAEPRGAEQVAAGG
ncbi:MAG: efflux RND transporter periplasmic adaptor subunit [Gemmatimonadota bacterium]|nr:MAG: efflux RND transporter periplasmic adaptor subunit [Gemmatimonadota bacterium]